jgi:hypothetical protein
MRWIPGESARASATIVRDAAGSETATTATWAPAIPASWSTASCVASTVNRPAAEFFRLPDRVGVRLDDREPDPRPGRGEREIPPVEPVADDHEGARRLPLAGFDLGATPPEATDHGIGRPGRGRDEKGGHGHRRDRDGEEEPGRIPRGEVQRLPLRGEDERELSDLPDGHPRHHRAPQGKARRERGERREERFREEDRRGAPRRRGWGAGGEPRGRATSRPRRRRC